MQRQEDLHNWEVAVTLEITKPSLLSSFYGGGHGNTGSLCDLSQVPQYIGITLMIYNNSKQEQHVESSTAYTHSVLRGIIIYRVQDPIYAVK